MFARAALTSKCSSARSYASLAKINTVAVRGISFNSTRAFKPVAFQPKCRSSPIIGFKPSFTMARRSFADSPFLKEADVESRILHVVKSFQKVDPNAVKKDSKFTDLGLDSLDIVELGLEIESEFAVEIPDAEMEKILSVPDAVKYICSHPTAK